MEGEGNGQLLFNGCRVSLPQDEKVLDISFSGAGSGLVTKSCPTLVTPRPVDCQASLSVGFPRQGY